MTKSNKISSPRNIYPKVYLFREKYGIYTYESESIQWFEFGFVIKKLVFWTHSQIDCALNICKLTPVNVLIPLKRVGTLIYLFHFIFLHFRFVSGMKGKTVEKDNSMTICDVQVRYTILPMTAERRGDMKMHELYTEEPEKFREEEERFMKKQYRRHFRMEYKDLFKGRCGHFDPN